MIERRCAGSRSPVPVLLCISVDLIHQKEFRVRENAKDIIDDHNELDVVNIEHILCEYNEK